MIDLKPCPICGQKNTVKICTLQEGFPFLYPAYYVSCLRYYGGCGATGGARDTKENAAKLWNTRAKNEV